jgi:hypothetical protein
VAGWYSGRKGDVRRFSGRGRGSIQFKATREIEASRNEKEDIRVWGRSKGEETVILFPREREPPITHF